MLGKDELIGFKNLQKILSDYSQLARLTVLNTVKRPSSFNTDLRVVANYSQFCFHATCNKSNYNYVVWKILSD